MKHGVVIREYKKWNRKVIYNNNYIMMKYHHIPKVINFTSSMMNDYNQDLCGGWTNSEVDNSNDNLIYRVVNKLKPFASLYCHNEIERDRLLKLINNYPELKYISYLSVKE